MILFCFVLVLPTSCRRSARVERAFYFWKTTIDFSAAEIDYMHKHQIKRLFVRLFDVSWDKLMNAATPVGKATWHNVPDHVEIIPVIYLTNETFQRSAAPIDLADHVSHLLHSYLNNHALNVQEIQFDCDWTLSTKEAYFAFLKRMKELHKDLRVTCTIRLHQIKYARETGIPPVDRGMLMFYNMGDVRDPRTQNSIFDAVTAKKYTASISSYPLHLDAALPAFEWAVVIRNNKIVELLHDVSAADFTSHPFWHKVNDQYYRNDSSHLYNNTWFRKGDLLRLESGGNKATLEAAQLLTKELPNDQRTISIFSFKGVNQPTLDETSLENVFAAFE